LKVNVSILLDNQFRDGFVIVLDRHFLFKSYNSFLPFIYSIPSPYFPWKWSLTRDRLTFIWGLILFFVNMLHIYHLCDEFFKYDVSTDVRLYVPQVIKVPTINLCFGIESVIKWSQLSQEDMNAVYLSDYRLSKKWYNFYQNNLTELNLLVKEKSGTVVRLFFSSRENMSLKSVKRTNFAFVSKKTRAIEWTKPNPKAQI